MAEYKKILLLDFDGVVHSYTSGWKGAHVIPDPPVAGLFEFLEMCAPHFELNIYSSRSHQEGGIAAMKNWFTVYINDHQLRLGRDLNFDLTDLKFPLDKPAAFLTIDDRALLFTGTWPDLATLLNFVPWNKK